MAADTISSLGGWTVSAVLHAGILTNYYNRPGLKRTASNLGSGAGFGSLTFQVPVYSPGSDAFAAHTEAGAITPDSVADSSFNVVIAQQVLDNKMSDEAMFVLDGAAWSNFMEQRAAYFADQADQRISSMICDLYDDFTDVTGTAGDDLTVDDLMVARGFMANLGGSGMAYGVMHPTQFRQLLNSMRAESLAGIFEQKNQEFGNLGAVKGTFCGDILLIETNLVGTVSSNHRGAMYRPDAFGYKHGIPQGLQTWAPGARTVQVTEGEIAAYFQAKGIQAPPSDMLSTIARFAGGLASNMSPEIYVEMGRQGNIGTRESVVAASMFVGVGQQVGRGTSLRSTTT